DEVAATADELRRLGVEAAALDLDVSDADAIARVAGAVTTALGPVDILVNNAGLAESAPFAKTDGALWDRHLRINATGPYLLWRASTPAAGSSSPPRSRASRSSCCTTTRRTERRSCSTARRPEGGAHDPADRIPQPAVAPESGRLLPRRRDAGRPHALPRRPG